ncbi:hypothetical protein [Nocardia beijingensis]|uniref:Uncharacterized protein n=1 Tax=Nocardia beijingensis TaxID=95162 RepID=A0ABW7WAK7_9NOCA
MAVDDGAAALVDVSTEADPLPPAPSAMTMPITTPAPSIATNATTPAVSRPGLR